MFRISNFEFSAYWRLSKPGIVRMVLVTAAFSYLLGGRGSAPWGKLLLALFGIGCAAAGSAALNNFLERDIDARMQRTRNRELPRGVLDPAQALGYGLTMVLIGVCSLVIGVNLLTAFLVLLTTFLYVLVYTPLKTRTWLNTTIGAIPGALPAMCGWVAATGTIDFGAWLMFLILFAWQHPHFYAIAWMYRDDYRKAGYKMLSVTDSDAARLCMQVLLYALMLLAVSILPPLLGMTGWVYLCGAVLLGLYMLMGSVAFIRAPSNSSARYLLRTSVIYLPLLFLTVALDLGVYHVLRHLG